MKAEKQQLQQGIADGEKECEMKKIKLTVNNQK